MTPSGMTRKVDSLGRLVLPAEMRATLGIAPGDAVDIALDGSAIVVRKVERRCVFCGGADEPRRELAGRLVCPRCLDSLRQDT